MQEESEISEKLSNDLLIQEYAAVISKMNSNESWAFSFVALYFAFLSALGTGIGFVLAGIEKNDILNATIVDAAGVGVVNYPWSIPLVYSISILGILLNFWAIFMVIDYKTTAKITNNHLATIEKRIHGVADASSFCFATIAANHDSNLRRAATSAFVGSVMFMFFVPWAYSIYYVSR